MLHLRKLSEENKGGQPRNTRNTRKNINFEMLVCRCSLLQNAEFKRKDFLNGV